MIILLIFTRQKVASPLMLQDLSALRNANWRERRSYSNVALFVDSHRGLGAAIIRD